MTHSPPPATVVQFNLRSLLVVMLVFVFVVAASTPLLRSWSETRRVYFWAFLLPICILLAGGVTFCAWYRRRTEKAAGTTIVRIVSAKANRWRIVIGVATIGQFALMVVGSAVLSATWGGTSVAPDLDVVGMMVMGSNCMTLLIWLSPCLCYAWWNAGPWTVEVCENGLIFAAFRLKSWADVIEFRWGTYYPNTLRVKLRYRGWTDWTDVAVPTQQRDTVESVFRERMAAAQTDDASARG